MPRTERRRRAWRVALTALAIVGGIGLGGALLRREGANAVLTLLDGAGWALLADCAVHATQLVLAGSAWRQVTRPGAAPRLHVFTALRWLREGINGMLPVLPIAGPLAGIRLLSRRGVTTADAVASIVADTSVELVTQVAFTALGVALLALAQGGGAVAGWMFYGIGGLTLAAVLLLPAQWFLARLAERLGKRLPWARGIRGLHDAIRVSWHDPRRVAGAMLAHLAAWLLGGAEVWLALHAFGAHVSAAECLVIESLAGAIRTAAFMVPGALGVQEGGLVLVCGLFGVPPASGLALSLFKRLREVAFGAPSLVLWLFLERQTVSSLVPPVKASVQGTRKIGAVALGSGFPRNDG